MAQYGGGQPDGNYNGQAGYQNPAYAAPYQQQQHPQYQQQQQQQYYPPPQQQYQPPQAQPYSEPPPEYGYNPPQAGHTEKYTFDEAFQVPKKKWNDIWAGILVRQWIVLFL
jgi:hypothetical protein